jgi:NADH-quinone oxidoreductase subunit F
VDVRTSASAATEIERAAVEAVLGAPAPEGERVIRGGHADRERRHLLLPALHALQDRVGWISRGGVDLLAERLSVAPAEIYGVATFYHLLSTQPRPALTVHVCDDVACRAAGGAGLMEEIERLAGPPGEEPTAGACWRKSACLGLCERGSAALVRRTGPEAEQVDVAVAPITAEQVAGLLRGHPPPPPEAATSSLPQTDQPVLHLLRRAQGGSATLPGFRAAGGLATLRRAFELGPEAVLSEVAASRLLGRGGAAFPASRKWEAVAASPIQPHYVVCNADESEPGTFKDRVLLERDPFGVLEALILAGFATGSSRGYIYVRDEYPLARARVAEAIAGLREAGWLGPSVGGSGFAFEVELRRGAGAYICGEETALFNSIEGRRGEPRNKPPFPVESGLFGRPTLVNNVETLLALLEAVEVGGAEYAKVGTEGSSGTKLFCLSGAVANPGLYEVEFGVTLGELIELAGGVPAGRRLRAVLLGGAAGSLVGPGRLDVPLTFEGTRAAGLTIGSGAIVVIDDAADLPAIVLRIAQFFREESCGQCVPCRVGTVRQEEALQRLLATSSPASRVDELRLLGEIAQVMRDASICGLGQTAANAVQSALAELREFS